MRGRDLLWTTVVALWVAGLAAGLIADYRFETRNAAESAHVARACQDKVHASH